MTPDQDAALAAYLTEWANMLELDEYQLIISYTNEGPTLDLHNKQVGGTAIRWLLGGRRDQLRELGWPEEWR